MRSGNSDATPGGSRTKGHLTGCIAMPPPPPPPLPRGAAAITGVVGDCAWEETSCWGGAAVDGESAPNALNGLPFPGCACDPEKFFAPSWSLHGGRNSVTDASSRLLLLSSVQFDDELRLCWRSLVLRLVA